VLIAIRHLGKIRDRCNYLSIYIILHNSRRAVRHGDIETHVQTLIDAGYVDRIKTTIRITEAGKQALNDLEKQLKHARYSYRKKKAQKSADNRPKPII
jgi:hypothetical protein